MARLMQGERAAMAVTSPPYGVGKEYEVKGVGGWFETIRPAIREICRAARLVVWQIGDLYATGTQFIEPTLVYSVNMFRENNFRPIWIRIWEKQGANFGVGPYHLVSNKPVQEYELIAALEEDGAEAPDYERGEYEWVVGFAGRGHRFVKRLSQEDRREWGYSGIWRINTVRANDQHPAMFPVELPERCVKMHSDVGDLVLEPFAGSGTTIVACENLGRRCVAVEREARYVAVCLQRYEDAFGLRGRWWRKRKSRRGAGCKGRGGALPGAAVEAHRAVVEFGEEGVGGIVGHRRQRQDGVPALAVDGDWVGFPAALGHGAGGDAPAAGGEGYVAAGDAAGYGLGVQVVVHD